MVPIFEAISFVVERSPVQENQLCCDGIIWAWTQDLGQKKE
ncbi:hypothetical protein [Laspinema olomoucense]|nr:hypothetical protein [Laspinema sp. D3d]